MDGVRCGAVCAVESYFQANSAFIRHGQEQDLAQARESAHAAAQSGVSRRELASVHQRAMLEELVRQWSGGGREASPNRWDTSLERMCATCPERCLDARAICVAPSPDIETVNDALRRVNEIREEEARRIARSLHDESSQLLASVHLALAEIGRGLPAPERPRLARVTGLLNEVQRHLRHISHELVPRQLAELGLTDALEYLRDGFHDRYGAAVDVRCEVGQRLPETVETVVYRVAQEAITNACTHGRASRVRLLVKLRRGRLLCSVRDNGTGFNAEEQIRSGMGMDNMRERVESLGGRLLVDSKPGKGTAVVAEIRVASVEGGRARKPVRMEMPTARRLHAHTSIAG